MQAAYLCHSASKIDPVLLRLAQEPDVHTRIEPRKRHIAHALAVERPKFRAAVPRHIVYLGSIHANVASPARQFRPGTICANRVPTKVCASLRGTTRFDKGNGKAVGYEKVDEPVRLDAGDVCER